MGFINYQIYLEKQGERTKMKFADKEDTKTRLLFVSILLGFIIKYSYLYYYIFQSPLISSLIIKNIINITLLLLASSFLFKNKKRIYFTVFIYLLFTLFFFANLWYNRYFGNYLSITDITMGQGIRPIKVIFFQLYSYFDLLFFIEFPFLIYLVFSISNNTKVKENPKKDEGKLRFNKNIIIIFLFIIIILGIQISYSSSVFKADGFLSLFDYSTPAFVSVYGITPLYITEYRLLKIREKNIVDVKDDKIETDKKLTGEYTAKNIENIVVIQLESLDEKIINFEHNGKEITPFLNKLKEKSLYFNDIYAQHINGSFDAEFSFLTSLYPINRNYAFKTNDMAEFNSIVKILNEKNYQTFAFHGNEEKFFYRDKGYLEMEFDEFYSRSDFSASSGEIGEDTYLGINDYDFFKQSINYLEDAKKPFFAFFITVSSHTPFDFYPEEYEIDEYQNIKNPLVKNYFNSMYFVDSSLKMFFEELEKKELIDNTLFVIYSDHTADINKAEYNSGDNYKINGNIKEPENIPLFIYYPEFESREYLKTGSHTDIAPTLLDILGHQEKPKEFLGVSLLRDLENPVLFLHEIPQILYKDQLFAKMPVQKDNEAVFEKIGHKKAEENESLLLPDAQKERLLQIINFMREVMNKILST